MPEDDLQNKYEVQFQIALLYKLDHIIQLLENIQNELTALGANVMIPDDIDWDDNV